MLSPAPPLPPRELAHRVAPANRDPYETFLGAGRAIRAYLDGLMPAGWSYDGKRVLDFGCGAGRTLRHCLDETSRAQIFGADIHEPSVAWVNEHLAPITAVACAEAPPLPWPDRHFDVIWAMSVFTHLTDHWATWMVELHRLLVDDGLLVATFMGSAYSETIAGEPWDEDRVGMNVLGYGQSFDVGGPMVLHSPWWIRAHWGRAFYVDRIELSGFSSVAGTENTQGYALLRKRPIRITAADLKRPQPDEPREWTAAEHQRHQSFHEIVDFRDKLAAYSDAYVQEAELAADLRNKLAAYSEAYMQETARVVQLTEELEQLRAERGPRRGGARSPLVASARRVAGRIIARCRCIARRRPSG